MHHCHYPPHIPSWDLGKGVYYTKREIAGISIILIAIYLVMWWMINAMFLNPFPSLWDFIWQTFFVLAIVTPKRR